MKVLFTGHRGFLGRELIPVLQEQVQVFEYPSDLSDFKYLSDYVKQNKIDFVIHAAARGGRRTKIDTEGTLIDNLTASINVSHLDIPTVAFCSGAIYGRQDSIYLATESQSLQRYPVDFYGQSKFIFRSYASQFEHISFLRFFNAFGQTEGLDRFISYNLNCYKKKMPMTVFKNFAMDFFYIKDLLPILLDWLSGIKLPQDLNLVYSQKLTLIEICDIINQVDNHIVPIELMDTQKARDYCGSGELLKSLNYEFDGLGKGIKELYLSEAPYG